MVCPSPTRHLPWCFCVPLELLGQVGARWALTVASIARYALVVVVRARRLRMNLATAGLLGLAGLTFEPFARTILLGQILLSLRSPEVGDRDSL